MPLRHEIALAAVLFSLLVAVGALGKGDLAAEVELERLAHPSAAPTKTCPDQWIAHQDAAELWVTYCVKASQ